jgi:hypothetical protein
VSPTRYVRFRAGGDPAPRWGRREGDLVVALSGPPWEAGCRDVGERAAADLVLLAPAQPTKFLALADNYRDRVAVPAARAGAGEAHDADPGFEPRCFV